MSTYFTWQQPTANYLLTIVVPVSLCVQVGCPDKAREAPLALKELYDEDMAEEDIIIAWHGKQDAAKVGLLDIRHGS